MRLPRPLRHLAATRWHARLAFSRRTLDALEQAVAVARRSHHGRIRIAIEGALDPRQLWQGLSARARALQVFAALQVWDTEQNNGVLVYILLADRAIEIVADRGLRERVRPAEWSAVVDLMTDRFRARRFRDGGVAGIEAAGALLARHFPRATEADGSTADDETDRPTLL